MRKNLFLHRLFPLLLSFSSAVGVSSAQSVPLNEIERAMRTGDVAGISGYFGNSIDITINKNQSTYSRTQAQMVLKDFFRKNGVSGFDFRHTGSAPSNNIVFCVGNLTTSAGTYKVYMYFRLDVDNAPVLREIRIEKMVVPVFDK